MEVKGMKTGKQELSEKEMELVQYMMADCKSTGDIQEKLKRLFAGTIGQMLEAEMEEHLGYEKNSVEGNNSGNSRNGYGKKTIISDYGECEIAVPRDRNGEFKPQVIEKRQTRTNEIEQKIMAAVNEGSELTAAAPVSDDDAMEIMPEEPTNRPRKSVDIDIAVDEG